MDNKYHVQCKKIFGDGTVIINDYNLNNAVLLNKDIVFHYQGKTRDYTMTVPNNEIMTRGVLNPNVHRSVYNKKQLYRCYYFQWKEDKNA